MSDVLQAIDLLAGRDAPPQALVYAVVGDEAFLQREVVDRLQKAILGDEGDREFSLTEFEGKSAEWADVREELATIAMFGGSQRMAVVRDADEMISRQRPALEDYVASPSRSGVLVLVAKSMPSNTRLYKAIRSKGQIIAAAAPKENQLPSWVRRWGKDRHGVNVPGDAAQQLVDLSGQALGLLDQELAKLALLVGADKKVTRELVEANVGSWRTRTAWEMVDRLLEGDVPTALKQLDRLLRAGEQPVAILAQVSYTLRRLAAATRIVINTELQGGRPNVGEALARAGVKRFVLEKSEGQLRRLGRQRGQEILGWLLQSDAALKGGSQTSGRAVLEELFVRIGRPRTKPAVR